TINTFSGNSCELSAIKNFGNIFFLLFYIFKRKVIKFIYFDKKILKNQLIFFVTLYSNSIINAVTHEKNIIYF
ncbi:MAG: hypothetical protein DRJ01_08085, partial [Bacteroidetes bacterium]